MIDLFSTGCYGIALGRDSGGSTRVHLGSNAAYREFDTVTETFLSPAPTLFTTNGIATEVLGNIVGGDRVGGGAAKFAPDGSVIWQSPAQPGVGSGSYSVVVDANNDVWAVHLDSSKSSKFSGVDGSPLGVFSTGRGPYTYSDATGLGLRVFFPTGVWTVIFTGGTQDLAWIGSVVSWSSDEPKGTSVSVRVRSSNDQVSWSEYVDVTNGSPILDSLFGQYLEIQNTLQSSGAEQSPILFDLTVDPSCGIEGPR